VARKNIPDSSPKPPPKDAPDHGMETYKYDVEFMKEPEKPPRDSKMGQDAADFSRDKGNEETPKPV